MVRPMAFTVDCLQLRTPHITALEVHDVLCVAADGGAIRAKLTTTCYNVLHVDLTRMYMRGFNFANATHCSVSRLLEASHAQARCCWICGSVMCSLRRGPACFSLHRASQGCAAGTNGMWASTAQLLLLLLACSMHVTQERPTLPPSTVPRTSISQANASGAGKSQPTNRWSPPSSQNADLSRLPWRHKIEKVTLQRCSCRSGKGGQQGEHAHSELRFASWPPVLDKHACQGASATQVFDFERWAIHRSSQRYIQHIVGIPKVLSCL